MTVESTLNKINYTANGVVDTFAYTFLVFEESHMFVYLDGVAYLGNLTITGLDNPAGGTVQLADIPADGVIVTLYRMVPTTQETDYEPYSDFPANIIERDYDLRTMESQQLLEAQGRNLQLSVDSDPAIDTTLPSPEAGKFFAWDPTGLFITFVDIINDIGIYIVTWLNTPLAIVQRDLNGDFAARIINALTFIGDLSGNATTATTAITATTATTATKHGVGSNALNIETIVIFGWDMDTDSQKSVSHGLDIAKIRKVCVSIVSDDGFNKRSIDVSDNAGVSSGRVETTSASFTLTRVANGLFDNAAYLSNSIIRGWITIEYID